MVESHTTYDLLSGDRLEQSLTSCSAYCTIPPHSVYLFHYKVISAGGRRMSLTMKNLAIGTFVVASCALFAYSFPDGAPVDTCVKPNRVNEPNHGQATSQPVSTSPYEFTASSSHYEPGSQITVTISGSSFKGFFIQARDPDTNNWIGSWAQTENTNTHPECSAVTHADPHVKQRATLVWNAPQDAPGRVYFTGTILKEYATYWSNVVATTQN